LPEGESDLSQAHRLITGKANPSNFKRKNSTLKKDFHR
jgi:hypothetical protein